MSRQIRNLSHAVALATICALLGACSDDDADPGSADKKLSTDVSPVAGEDALPAGVVALPEPTAGTDYTVLSGATYRVPLSESLAIDVDLPAGTESDGRGLYLIHDGTVLKVEAAGDDFGVPSDPCNGFEDITPAGSTVDDVVQAIQDRSPYQVSRPEPVEIGGATGRYFELRIPSGFDASSCVDSQVGLPGNPGSNNNMAPGYVGQWWILEAEGQRAAIQTFCEKCGPDESTPLMAAVQSITFTATP